VSLWVKGDLFGPLFDVRFIPESDRLLRRREMTLWCLSDQSASQQFGEVKPELGSTVWDAVVIRKGFSDGDELITLLSRDRD